MALEGALGCKEQQKETLSILVKTIPHQILKQVWLLKRKNPTNYTANVSLSVDIRRKVNGLIEFEETCISLEAVEWHLLVR